jgi:hypothetical protein
MGRDLIVMLFLIGVLSPMFIATRKGRPTGKWFFYSLFVWPIALVHALVIRSSKLCPNCFERVDRQAKVCPHCLGGFAT